MVYRYRGYLPHLESPGAIYFVTFRLADALPKIVLDSWRFERQEIQQEADRQRRQLSEQEEERLKYLYSQKVEEYLDQLHGNCWLRNPIIAQLVVDVLKHFHEVRYYLHA